MYYVNEFLWTKFIKHVGAWVCWSTPKFWSYCSLKLASECIRMHLRHPKISKFYGGACPRTPLAVLLASLHQVTTIGLEETLKTDGPHMNQTMSQVPFPAKITQLTKVSWVNNKHLTITLFGDYTKFYRKVGGVNSHQAQTRTYTCMGQWRPNCWFFIMIYVTSILLNLMNCACSHRVVC